MTVQPTDSILIVDFGSQVTQLIARRVREAGVYSEIVPFNAAGEAFERMQPKGVILSGGPSSVMWEDAPSAPQNVFDSGVPMLGICYGQQTLHQQLGGRVVASDQKEFGRAFIEVVAASALFDGLWNVGEKHQVWMSHGDRVETLAPGFEVVATSEGAPYAIATDEDARYTVMFHPEVVHTPDGGKLLANFARHICGCAGDWTMASFRDAKIAEIREQVGQGQGDLRPVGRRRQRGRRGADPRGDRRPADLRVRRPRPDARWARRSRSSRCSATATTSRWSMWTPRRCSCRASPASPTPRPSASSSARPSSTCSTRRRRKIGGADFLAQGTLYPGRDRERQLHRRAVGDDQEPPQCRRAARADEHEAGRAAARAVQGRGARARPRAGPARSVRRAPPVPRAGPRHPHPRRGDQGEVRHPAQGGRHLSRGDPQRRPLRRDLAGVRGAAAGAHGRRDGRLSHLRLRLRAARGDQRRRHDRRHLRLPRPTS